MGNRRSSLSLQTSLTAAWVTASYHATLGHQQYRQKPLTPSLETEAWSVTRSLWSWRGLPSTQSRRWSMWRHRWSCWWCRHLCIEGLLLCYSGTSLDEIGSPLLWRQQKSQDCQCQMPGAASFISSKIFSITSFPVTSVCSERLMTVTLDMVIAKYRISWRVVLDETDSLTESNWCGCEPRHRGADLREKPAHTKSY